MYTDREASDENDTEHIYLKFAMDKKKKKKKFKIWPMFGVHFKKRYTSQHCSLKYIAEIVAG